MRGFVWLILHKAIGAPTGWSYYENLDNNSAFAPGAVCAQWLVENVTIPPQNDFLRGSHLRIGQWMDINPEYARVDGATGTLVGADIDLLDAMQEILGFTYEIVDYSNSAAGSRSGMCAAMRRRALFCSRSSRPRVAFPQYCVQYSAGSHAQTDHRACCTKRAQDLGGVAQVHDHDLGCGRHLVERHARPPRQLPDDGGARRL